MLQLSKPTVVLEIWILCRLTTKYLMQHLHNVYHDNRWQISDQLLIRWMHCMQCGLPMRKLSVCPSVRPSVHPSVKRVHCDKQKKNLSRFLHYAKDHLA